MLTHQVPIFLSSEVFGEPHSLHSSYCSNAAPLSPVTVTGEWKRRLYGLSLCTSLVFIHFPTRNFFFFFFGQALCQTLEIRYKKGLKHDLHTCSVWYTSVFLNVVQTIKFYSMEILVEWVREGPEILNSQQGLMGHWTTLCIESRGNQVRENHSSLVGKEHGGQEQQKCLS